jgi:hypothetical protein
MQLLALAGDADTKELVDRKKHGMEFSLIIVTASFEGYLSLFSDSKRITIINFILRTNSRG